MKFVKHEKYYYNSKYYNHDPVCNYYVNHVNYLHQHSPGTTTTMSSSPVLLVENISLYS